jgi:hypothetical protein
MHSIFVLQDMGLIGTVLPSRSWNDTIVVAVITAVSIEKLEQFPFTLGPINSIVL